MIVAHSLCCSAVPPSALFAQGNAHRVVFVTRVAWYNADGEFRGVTIGSDHEVMPCRNYPTLSVLWLRDPAHLTKSLTCSACGPSVTAYWYCSDAGCHLALCPACYSRARFPREPGIVLPTGAGAGGVVGAKRRRPDEPATASLSAVALATAAVLCNPLQRFCLAPPSPCAALRLTPCPECPPPFPDLLRAGLARDRSHVLIPFSTVTLLGLGEDQRRRGTAATHYTHRSRAFGITYGCYPFVVSWVAGSTFPVVAKSVEGTATLLSDTRVERLLIDLRCHQSSDGFLFHTLVYSAQRVVDELLLPFLIAFRISKGVSRSPLLVSDVVILLQVCCASVNTFCTLLGELQAKTGVPVQMLVIDQPLLVFDIDSVTPFVLPPFVNRLDTRSLREVLLCELSAAFLDAYRPELLTSPSSGVVGAPYERHALCPAPPLAAVSVVSVPPVAASVSVGSSVSCGGLPHD